MGANLDSLMIGSALAPKRGWPYPAAMSMRRLAVVVVLSAVIANLCACGDDLADVEENAARCDATEPVRVTTLGRGIADYLRVMPVGEHVYINIYNFLEIDGEQDPLGLGAIVDGQTWVSGPCGEAATLVGEGYSFDADGASLGTLTPVFYGDDSADADPTLACESGYDGRDRIYRVDLSGQAAPVLLLEGWSCGIDVTRMVASRRDDDVHELWRVPNFPDLEGAVRLAADVQTRIGRDADHEYYVDGVDALHAVDIRSGVDEVLQANVLRAAGGATGRRFEAERTGPTRLLWLSQEPGEGQGVYLFRGETGEAERIADVQPVDLPDPPSSGWAWGFDNSYEYLAYQPFGESGAYVRVFDLEGAPLVFPEGVRSEYRFSGGGVLGSVEGPQGSRWVYARPGEVEATELDMPWDPALHVYTVGSDDLYYLLNGRVVRVPLDGGAAVEVIEPGWNYSEGDGVALHDGKLVHVDRATNDATVLRGDVGAHGPAVVVRDGAYEMYGIFFTDVSSPEAPALWFMPRAALPGGV